MILTHDVIAVLIIIGLIAAFVWLARRSREKDFETLDTIRLLREIDLLYKRAHELQDVDDLLIDLRLCKHNESFRAFRMGWQSASGKEHVIDFLTDGSDLSSRQLQRLAEAKREELNQEVAARITNLYVLACQSDYSDYTERSGKNSGINCDEFEEAGEYCDD